MMEVIGTSRPPTGEPLIQQDKPIADVMFSPDGTTMATVTANWSAHLWHTAGQQLPLGHHRLGHTSKRKTRQQARNGGRYDARHVGSPQCAAFSPDGSILAVAGFYYQDHFRGEYEIWVISLWDTATCEPIGEPIIDDTDMPANAGHTNEFTCVAFSPDGTTLASTSLDGTVRLWDVPSGRPLGLIVVDGDEARACAFSPDGRILAAASCFAPYDSDLDTVEFWDPTGREQIGDPLIGHTAPIYGIAFSPDGHTVATAGGDGAARLWDTVSRDELGAPLTGHGEEIYCAEFSPDGRILATAGGDGTVRLWSVADRERLGNPLTAHIGAVYDVAFSPDRPVLATAGKDGTVRLWDLKDTSAM